MDIWLQMAGHPSVFQHPVFAKLLKILAAFLVNITKHIVAALRLFNGAVYRIKLH